MITYILLFPFALLPSPSALTSLPVQRLLPISAIRSPYPYHSSLLSSNLLLFLPPSPLLMNPLCHFPDPITCNLLFPSLLLLDSLLLAIVPLYFGGFCSCYSNIFTFEDLELGATNERTRNFCRTILKLTILTEASYNRVKRPFCLFAR